jgi:hypothetical protein
MYFKNKFFTDYNVLTKTKNNDDDNVTEIIEESDGIRVFKRDKLLSKN